MSLLGYSREYRLLHYMYSTLYSPGYEMILPKLLVDLCEIKNSNAIKNQPCIVVKKTKDPSLAASGGASSRGGRRGRRRARGSRGGRRGRRRARGRDVGAAEGADSLHNLPRLFRGWFFLGGGGGSGGFLGDLRDNRGVGTRWGGCGGSVGGRFFSLF